MAESLNPLDQLKPYMDLLWYEYALRREAGLEPNAALFWSLRRILPAEGLHPALGWIAGHNDDESNELAAAILIETIINVGEGVLKNWQSIGGWQPGTVGPW